MPKEILLLQIFWFWFPGRQPLNPPAKSTCLTYTLQPPATTEVTERGLCKHSLLYTARPGSLQEVPRA
jgi:hypothetical protein